MNERWRPGIIRAVGFFVEIGIILFGDLALRLGNALGALQQPLHPMPQMVREGHRRGHSRARERQEVDDHPPNPVLAREIFRSPVDDGFPGIRVTEPLCYAIVVGNIEGVQEVREHFTAALQMQYMQEGIGQSIWKG